MHYYINSDLMLYSNLQTVFFVSCRNVSPSPYTVSETFCCVFSLRAQQLVGRGNPSSVPGEVTRV